MSRYVIDTHALLWYITTDSRIGSRAKGIIEQCENGTADAVIPSIVLIEAIRVLINPRKGINYNPADLLDWLDAHAQFSVYPLDINVVRAFNSSTTSLASLHDDHDRIIVVTSVLLGNIPILTRATDIGSVAPTIWS